jgi:YihY family inner membrane protein
VGSIRWFGGSASSRARRVRPVTAARAPKASDGRPDPTGNPSEHSWSVAEPAGSETQQEPQGNVLERAIRNADRAQQRVGPVAFVFAVVRKFGDDRGGALCALMAFYGFLSLFPLLLLLVTVLGFVSGGEHSLVRRVEVSAFSQFPIAGTKLSTNIHPLHGRSLLGLAVGIAGTLWGSKGAIQTAQYAQAEVWNVPQVNRPNFWTRLGRTGAMTLTLGVFLIAGAVLAGLVTLGGHGWWTIAGAILASLVVNVGLFIVAFRLLTPKQVGWSSLLPGAVVGGVGWTALQLFGGLLVEHSLRNTSKEYGTFAVVLGLLGFLYVAAQLSVYCAEMNVVLARRLWPRSVVQPPLTEADRRVLSSLALEGKRRPEQHVLVGFHDEGSVGASGEAQVTSEDR